MILSLLYFKIEQKYKILTLLHIKHITIRLTGILFVGLILSGCNPTKYVPSEKYLLNKVKVYSTSKKINRIELKTTIRQKANKRILGAKVYLWFYNRSNIQKPGGIHKYLRSIGEEPVIWDPQATESSVKQMKNYLSRKGYLNAEIKAEKIFNDKQKKVKVYYYVQPNQPYTIRNIKYAFEDTTIQQLIFSDTVNSLIKKEKQPLFDEDLLENERVRIEYMMKDNGYYRFSRYLMYVEADTSLGTHQVDLALNFTKEAVKLPNGNTITVPYKQYKINDVIIRTDLGRSQQNRVNSTRKDTIMKYGVKFIYQNNFWVKPNIIQQSNYVIPRSLFKISDVEKTKIHLASLNVFSLVNTNQFVELPFNDTSKYNYVDCYVRLTPHDIQGYNLELEGTNSSGNIGGAFNVVYNHRSLFGNAENLRLKFRGALESLKEEKTNKLNKALEYGVEATLDIPKFLIPFNSMGFRKKYNPKTYITWAYNYLNRPDFTRTIATVSFGYNWKSTKHKTYSLSPLDFNYVRVMNTSSEFDSLIHNTYLENLYTDHLISLSSFSYTYNNQDLKKVTNYNYFRWNVESAGNILQLYNTFFSKSPGRDESGTAIPHKFFSLQYAQYIKTDIDFHYFHLLNEGDGMVYRIFAGIGIPYGNASSLPFEKQYFSGGANSLRGWQVRTLGPGNYVDTTRLKNYPNSTGEIKLEANMEYRFKFGWLLEGALFTDIGNVWLIPGNDKPESAVFRLNSFYKQIAVSSGFGLRFNFNYFIFRVDLGLKVRNPAIKKWIINYRTITHDDLALSFAIGYPF